MADHDSDIPEGPRREPDPHRGEPVPSSDAHTRPGPDTDAVRPDQQEELGPVEGLMHAASVEATAEVTGDPEAEAEAARLGVEGEGVEAAQIFGLMLATAVVLVAAVVGVFFLVGYYADEETVERDAVALYPELREVQRVAAEMENYSRTDSLYRIPIGAAMSQVATAYYTQQQGGNAVPAPDNFSTLYLDAIRELGPDIREYEVDAVGYQRIRDAQNAELFPAADSLGQDTEAGVPAVEGENGPTPSPTDGNEPEDR